MFLTLSPFESKVYKVHKVHKVCGPCGRFVDGSITAVKLCPKDTRDVINLKNRRFNFIDLMDLGESVFEVFA